MFQSERNELIIQYLSENKFLTVEKAIELTDSSPATIRRDFKNLDQSGLVRRFRGGVRIRAERVDGSLPFILREIQLASVKQKLAERAAKMIWLDSVLFVDGGTTTYCLAPYLADIKGKIITNSFRLAVSIENFRSPTSPYLLYLTGGRLSKTNGLMIGPGAKKSLEQYHADLAFLSVGGVTEKGAFNTNDTIVQTETKMVENADRVIILADHRKIGQSSMCHLCELEKIHVLITDLWPENEELLEKIKQCGIEVILVDCQDASQFTTSDTNP